ncbi:hypothetical protein V8E54_003263 [Elaphomyces granulatus]
MTAFKKENAESSYETFHAVCIMAPEVRWGKLKLPSVNAAIQVMGLLQLMVTMRLMWFPPPVEYSAPVPARYQNVATHNDGVPHARGTSWCTNIQQLSDTRATMAFSSTTRNYHRLCTHPVHAILSSLKDKGIKRLSITYYLYGTQSIWLSPN